jgi:hypothetical protein
VVDDRKKGPVGLQYKSDRDPDEFARRYLADTVSEWGHDIRTDMKFALLKGERVYANTWTSLMAKIKGFLQ